MVDADMSGVRFIEKVLPESRQGYDGRAPPIPRRIHALLNYLKRIDQRNDNQSISRKDNENLYHCLKVFARRIRRSLFDSRHDLRGVSWKQLGEKHLSLQKQLCLELEKTARDEGIDLHLCVEMWGADRLLFEAFRGYGKKDDDTNKSNDNIQTGSEPEFEVEPQAEVESESDSDVSLASDLRSVVDNLDEPFS